MSGAHASSPPAPPPWREILHGDCQRLADLLRDAAADKVTRQAVRALVWRVHEAIAVPDAAEDAQGPDALGESSASPAPALSDAELLCLVRETEAALLALGEARGNGARRIADVRIARPFADRVQVPASSRQTVKLAAAVARHFDAKVALTDARLKWFETRLGQSAPTSIAEVKQPQGDQERLDLELLRKAGKSKYS